jgi:ZipA, C-terminal FtsZ-binding domain
MKKMPYIIIGLIALGLIAYFFFKQKNKPVTQDYFISTQGQSEERVKNLDLDSASENASYILDFKKLSFPKTNKETENVEYKPDTEKDWIINIKTANSFTTDQLFKIFDKDWRVNFGAADIYGYSDREKKWTYAIVGGEPDTYTKIQVAIDLVEIYEVENSTYDTKKLEKYITELKKKLNAFPTKLEFDETIEQAASRGKQLAELKNEFDIEVIILLKSEKTFNGKLAWDALQSVGLVWGDGDLFHWNNEEDYGHDQHFSVWTTTEPGYFMPEDIKDGSMNPTDLGFSFSVPRSADPKNVFAVMFDAVKYCQKRLGGTILDKDGNPFNEVTEKKYLDELIEKMKKKGLTAGSDKALRMF